MLNKFAKFILKHKDVAIYILFGVLTTAVSYGVYFPLYNLSKLSATACNLISWIAAVLFAFLTNKPFVFHSYDWSAKTVFLELLKFTGSRIGSFLVETAFIFALVDIMCLNGNIIKIVISIVVVLLNYLASKFLVFRD